MRFFDKVQADEVIFDDDDEHIEEDIDEYETRDQESDTEEDLSDNEHVEIDTGPCYLGKDGTKWRKVMPPQNVRTISHNLVTHLPGVTVRARGKNTPIDCWKCFFDEEVVDIIVENTNTFIFVKCRKLYQGKRCQINESE